MQNTGQYGVSDSPQFAVGRTPPAHFFSISHDNMSIAPPAGHALQATGHHPQQQQQQHHLPHHLQAQQQHHHFGAHLGHQPHPSLQQIHQTQSPHASHAPHPQFPLAQHAQQPPQAHQQQQASAHPDAQQHQQVHQQQQAQQQAQQVQQQQAAEQAAAAHQAAQQAQQKAMVQQLGLGGPDSPEAPSPTNYTQQIVSAAAQQDDDGMEEEGRSAGGNRWPRQETLALIKIRSEMDANFRDSGLKGPLWEEVSRKLAELGYQRNAKKCKEKFENVHKYYKKTKDGRAGRQDGKSYRFFSQLEALYGGQQSSAAQLESNAAVAAAASLLTGTPMLQQAKPPPPTTTEDYNVSAQRPSEVSTGVTLTESSEDDYDEPGSGEADNQQQQEKTTSSKKRKRMMEGKLGTTSSAKLDSFESLMKNLLDKQESMQRKFFEFMERREQERQVREEEWRRQEIARLAREHDLRTQEHALAATRDAALVAFLQKATGQTLQLPQFPTRPPSVVPLSIDSVVASAAQKQASQAIAPPPASATTFSQALALANADEHEKDSAIDPNSKRWPNPEVLTLIKLRSDMEPRFQV